MRARALFAGLASALALAVSLAGPASAKGFIAEANISGPGLGGAGGGSGMKVEAPAADTMWELSGASWMKVREDSLSELGLASPDLGPRYLVTYRYHFGPGREDDLIRQDLYPYADGGTVTFTPPGQVLTGEGMARVGSGWFQAEPEFLEFLVENGLPATNPVAAPVKAPSDRSAPGSRPAPWAWMMLLVPALAALSLIAPWVRRRMLSAARVNR